jgi:hypothetical protein
MQPKKTVVVRYQDDASLLPVSHCFPHWAHCSSVSERLCSSNGGAATAPAPPSAGTDSTGQTVDDPNTIVATDETSTGSDIRMLKMQKLRSQMFNPGTSSASPTSAAASATDATTAVVRRSLKSVSDAAAAVAPQAHQQIAMLKEGSRECMQQRLNELFQDTRRAQLARKRARQQQQQYENAPAE